MSGAERVEIAGVLLSSPDKVLWPEMGVTKLDLARYCEAMAGRLLPHVAGRPLTLLRCPQGRGARCFVQRHAGPGFGKAVRRVRPKNEMKGGEGKGGELVAVDDLAGLVSLVQIGVLEFHPWLARTDDPDRPDRLIFDLDPGEDTGWDELAEAAREVRGRLEQEGLVSFVKTSGGKGIHVVCPIVPRAGWDEAKDFVRSLAQAMETERPARYTTSSDPQERRGRIFIDYLRNARSASAVAAWSPRARPGAPVSTPLAWEDLDGAGPDSRIRLAVADVSGGRLSRPDPWPDLGEVRQDLPRR
jgi:bifunctional non-homologous end joining protein LigD